MSITQFQQEMRGHLPILWEGVSPRRWSLSEEQPPRRHSIGSRDSPDAVMHPNRIGTWKRSSGRRESKAAIYRMRSKWREIVQPRKREPENRPQIEEIGLGEHDMLGLDSRRPSNGRRFTSVSTAPSRSSSWWSSLFRSIDRSMNRGVDLLFHVPVDAR